MTELRFKDIIHHFYGSCVDMVMMQTTDPEDDTVYPFFSIVEFDGLDPEIPVIDWHVEYNGQVILWIMVDSIYV